MHSSKLRLALVVTATLFLLGCATVGGTSCPPPRYPDERVAEELENIPETGFEDFWSWMDATEVLNDQLASCG